MKIRNRSDRRQGGFSLAELMVVIVIIGLLVTLVGSNVIRQLFRGQVGAAKADIASIVQALEQYAVENNGKYPDSLEVLVTPDENGYTFLDRDTVPLDPWKNEYQYEAPGPGNPKPRVYTFGADGVPGGEGKDKDIDNIMIKNGEA